MFKALQFSVIAMMVTIIIHPGCILAQVQNDADGDGISDITYISSSSSNRTWTRVLSQTDTTEDSVTFGLTSDAIALGHWEIPSFVNFGIIESVSDRGVLEWKILQEDGRILPRDFGKPGDIVMVGADFDGNQIADAALVRQDGEQLRWNVNLNLFITDAENQDIRKFKFGKVGGRIFFLNLEGERDWLGVFSKTKGKKKRGVMRLRKVGGGPVRKFAGFPKILVDGSAPLRPFPIGQPDGTDLVGFVKAGLSDTRIYVFNTNAEQIGFVNLPGTGEVIVGDYDSSDEGEEILFQSNSLMYTWNPVSDALSSEDVISGTIIDEINVTPIGTPAVTPTPTLTPTPTPTP